jgi:MFS family permease
LLISTAVLSYFLGKVLQTIGITSDVGQSNITLINNCQQFCFALFGANLVDRVGRRPLLLFSNAGCCVVWLAMTVSAAKYQESILEPGEPGTNHSAGAASLAFIFIFGAVYSVGFTPLQALYPVEVLSFEMRAKGMGFSGFAVAAAMLLNQFVWPISMDKIGWRTYIIFTIWCGIQAATIFFFIPETKNRTVSAFTSLSSSASRLTINSLKNLMRSSALQTLLGHRSPRRESALTHTARSLISRRSKGTGAFHLWVTINGVWEKTAGGTGH